MTAAATESHLRWSRASDRIDTLWAYWQAIGSPAIWPPARLMGYFAYLKGVDPRLAAISILRFHSSMSTGFGAWAAAYRPPAKHLPRLHSNIGSGVPI